MMSSKPHTSIVQPFIARATNTPDDLAVVLIGADGQETNYSIGELYSRAKHFAHSFSNHGISKNDIVILVLPHSFDLLTGFWGIQLAGAVSTIYNYKSALIKIKDYYENVVEMVSQSGANAILTIPEYKDGLKELLVGIDCVVISTEDETPGAESTFDLSHISNSADDLAILQYSSGTLGLRKGVMLPHQAVLNYLDRYVEMSVLRSNDVVVSWLPLYHDMGLMANFLAPVVIGIPTVLMSPYHWLRNPISLFKAIDKHHASLAWMPNFAFSYCVRSISDEDLQGLNLSSMRKLVNGAEPVDINSLRTFYDKFSPYGFKESAFAVGYGLAENVLSISRTPMSEFPRVDWISQREFTESQIANPISKESADAKPIVSCGTPMSGVEIRIVDGADNPLPNRRVGEIVIRCDSLFDGYYQREDLTKQVLRDGWFYTGDLGYMADEQIYVTGRKKDLIIVAGDNIYPQDIEAIANSIEGLRPGRSVAFGITIKAVGTERIVVVAELKQPLDEEAIEAITQKLRANVLRKLGVKISKVHLTAERDWVIKTPSGKIAHPANKEKYLKLIAS